MKAVRLPIFLLMLLAVAHSAEARKPKRFGFQGFPATYKGGYSILVADQNTAGPAIIRIRAARNGRSASVTWTNTFYDEKGSFRIALRWSFRPDGTFFASTLDPRSRQFPSSGTFLLDGNRPVVFSAASGLVKAEGKLRLIGGGALSIIVTLTGLPEGAITYSFSGGR